MANNVFKTIATPVERYLSDRSVAGQHTSGRMAIDSKENMRAWYSLFRDMALECPDFRRQRKSVEGGK